MILLNLDPNAETKLVPIEVSWNGSDHWQAGCERIGYPITEIGSGWQFVAIVETTGTKEVPIFDPKDHYNSRGRYPVPAVFKSALLSRTKDAAEADERRRARIEERLKREFDFKVERAVEEAKEAIEGFDERVKELQNRAEALTTELRVKGTSLRAAREALDKIERDLAKVREAVGSVRMREILGEEKK